MDCWVYHHPRHPTRQKKNKLRKNHPSVHQNHLHHVQKTISIFIGWIDQDCLPYTTMSLEKKNAIRSQVNDSALIIQTTLTIHTHTLIANIYPCNPN